MDITNSTATGSGIDLDTYLGIENIITGSGNDSINSDATAFFANTINFNLGNGSNDKVVLSSGAVGTDATTFASKLQNVEYLDFRAANTSGGALVIDGNDVFSMTDSSHTLRLDIRNSFALNVQAGSYAMSSVTTGNLTACTFTSGGSFAAKLDVYTT